MVKSIFLQDGEEIFVDGQDYERVNQYNWCKVFTIDTYYKISTLNEERKTVTLSNFILKNSYQKIKNNDFTRNNLTTEGNKARWASPTIRSSSRYKGVSWNKKRNKWRATITIQGKAKHLGNFKNEWDAAQAYNNAVDCYWDGQGFKNVKGQLKRQAPQKHTNCKQHRLKNAKSGYKGVHNKPSKTKPFGVQISFQRKMHHVGYFKDKHQAALAYNKVALFLHGEENAILNDVPMTDELKDFISNWEIPDRIKALKSGWDKI